MRNRLCLRMWNSTISTVFTTQAHGELTRTGCRDKKAEPMASLDYWFAVVNSCVYYCGFFHTVPTELKRCNASGKCGRSVRLVTKCTITYCERNRMDLEAAFLHTYAHRQGTLACRCSFESSTFLTFIFKVKDSNRLRREVRM